MKYIEKIRKIKNIPKFNKNAKPRQISDLTEKELFRRKNHSVNTSFDFKVS